MDSWRYQVNRMDRSSVAIPVAGAIGAMVIRAPYGDKVPTKINKGDENRILRLYGKPSVTYPDIWEAIQFNKLSPMWICAPFMSTDTYGGVKVGSMGASALQSGLTQTELDSYTFSGSNDYFLVTPLAPCKDFLALKMSVNIVTQVFTMSLYQTLDNGLTWGLVDNYTFSMQLGAKDGFGQSMYISDIFKDNDYVKVMPNPSASVNLTSAFVQNLQVNFAGGTRVTASVTITQIQECWNYFKQSRKYEADIFMDTTANAGIPEIFDGLASISQKYASYIMPFPMRTSPSAAPTIKSGYSINNPNLNWYWNNQKVRDTYNNSSFWTSCIGRVGYKYAQMQDVFNGLAPAYIDDNPNGGHGGQLGSGILDAEYDPTEDELQALDEAGINPIVFDNTYGAMIVGDKSGQTPTTISDYSYIPHVRMFNYIIKNILNQVFPYQTVKLNDSTHRNLARLKVQQICNPIKASNILSDFKAVCDLSNNTDITRAKRQFILTLAVQVTPFSEFLILNFINTPQGTSVQEVTP
jgi:hypothetical protein